MIDQTLLEQTELIAQIGFWDWDAVHDVWHGSTGWYQLFGIPYGTPLRMKSILEMVHQDDRPSIAQSFELVASGAPPAQLQFRVHRGGDGALRYLHTWGGADFSADGTITRLHGVTQDITDRREADLVQARLAAIVESSDDAIIGKDLNGVLTDWNRAAERLYGYTAAEAIGQPISILFAGQTEEYLATILRKISNGERIENYDTTRRTKDGRVIHVSLTISPIRDANGVTVGASTIAHDITERRCMEEELRASQAMFQNYFNISGAGICVSLPNKAWLDVNDRMCDMIGYSREELANMTWIDFTHPDDVDTDLSLYNEIIDGKRDSYIIDKRFIRKDGAIMYATLSETCQRNPDGSVHHFLAHVTDITERKLAEEALRQSEQRYRLLTEHMSDVVWVMDVEKGCFTYVSPSVERLRGYTADEVMAQPTFDALTHDSQQRLLEFMQARHREFTTGNEYRGSRIELEQPRRDGTTVWTEAAARFHVNEETGRLETYGVSRDITERRQIESDLRTSEERYRQLADGSPLSIAVIDAETSEILYANPRSFELFEVDGATIFGEIGSAFLVDVNDFDRLRQVVINQGYLRDAEVRMRTSTGREFWVSLNINVTTFQGRPALHIVYLDISARKQLEEELRHWNDELGQRVTERTGQLAVALGELQRAEESKDAFLAAISHELRTPLTGVLGMADALELQISGPLNERQIHSVRQIRASGDRLLKMVNSILHYTSLLAGKVTFEPDECRLLELGAMSLRSIRSEAIKKDLSVKFAIEPHDLAITSNPDGIRQILENLLDNAVKFTPDGGVIGLIIADDPALDAVQLIVWDTGIGIPPDRLADIFKPFEQLDKGLSRQYEGVGLGLAYVQQLVRLLGGTITVESTVGQGSRFFVTLQH